MGVRAEYWMRALCMGGLCPTIFFSDANPNCACRLVLRSCCSEWGSGYCDVEGLAAWAFCNV